jgi:hypothetical protein
MPVISFGDLCRSVRGVDELQKGYHELAFRLRYHETGESFQTFFSTLMQLRHPRGDFAPVRPWGKFGDRKNDGYLRSKRQLFQCFGPDEMKPLSKCTTKIKEDFKGALPYWREHFDAWIFVHNDPKGLAPDVLKLLLDLTKKHKDITATHWGLEDLLAEFRQLSEADMVTLVGPAPGRKDVVGVRVEDVRRLLEHISLQPEPVNVDVRPVPASKLQHNQLSDAAATLLKAGMTRAEVVKKYLRGLVDQTRYDRIAAAFKLRYQELKAEGYAPDDILAHLQRFVSGGGVTSLTHQAATLAILAFFFEACEIFERPPGSGDA